MEHRTLGKSSLQVSELGLGCMGMSWAYGPTDEAESTATLHEAIDLGINFLDTAEVYGPYKNEEFLGRALAGKREQVVLATKFGYVHNEEGRIVGFDGSPARVRASIEGSLTRLRVDCVDLYYAHRVDPNVPIEETVGAMAELVQAGKVRYLGLSEAGPGTLRRACAVHPIAALQTEYSLFERGIEAEILPACRELGIGFVPYSPLGRGFLTGQVKRAEDYAAEGDNRQNFPRFQGVNYDRNLALVKLIEELAIRKGATPAQIALAWLLCQGPDIVPIPGTKRRKYLRENIQAINVRLSTDDLTWLDRRFPVGKPAGERYPERFMKMIDR